MADNNRLHNKLALASCASMLEVLLNFCTYHLQPRNSSFKRFPSSSGANCQKDDDKTTERFAAHKLWGIKTSKSIWMLCIYAVV